MAMAQQKVIITIPKELKPVQRRELADLVIEHIFERTTVDNKDKNGKKFPAYSKEYVKSLDFANAGKSKSDVNLQLSGDMLAAMQLLKDRPGEIIIGYERGSPENGKAEGNILGTYGSDTPNRKKARDFLGVQSKKLKELVAYVKNNVD
jgi:hypothetical protein